MTSESLVAWLANGERGCSSNTIVQHLTGIKTSSGKWGPDHPHDPSDLRRCRLLLEQVPELAPRISEMAKASPSWAMLIAHWDTLLALMDKECPEWRHGTGMAKETYRVMQDLLQSVREAKS